MIKMIMIKIKMIKIKMIKIKIKIILINKNHQIYHKHLNYLKKILYIKKHLKQVKKILFYQNQENILIVDHLLQVHQITVFHHIFPQKIKKENLYLNILLKIIKLIQKNKILFLN